MAEANEREQRAFDTASKQTLAMLTSDKAAAMIAQDAQQRGPDAALADAMKMAAAQVQKAATGAGVELPPEVVQASQRAVAQVLVAMMAESGMTDDPEGLLEAVEAQIAAPAEAQQPPQQPQQQGPGVLAQGAM